MRLPQRPSLVTDTASVLREGIASGEWSRLLPGERSLVERLQVSRSTLRAALALLERQGLVSAAAGRARTILHRHASGFEPPDRVGLLSLQPVDLQRAPMTYLLHRLREHLQDAGLRLEVHAERRLAHGQPQKLLDRLQREIPTTAWLLVSVPESVQRWFQDHGPPALVVGSCHDGIRLPSFDLDLAAVCRHAAGLLRARGHRRVAFVRQPVKSAGMKASERGFFAGARSADTAPGDLRLISHNGTPRGICVALDRALASRHPPTGFLVCDPGHAICAASHLISRGFSLPRDLSLVSRDHDDLLPFFRPAITHYDYRKSLFARRLARLAIQLAAQGRLPVRNYGVIPKNVPGETLGDAAERPSEANRPPEGSAGGS